MIKMHCRLCFLSLCNRPYGRVIEIPALWRGNFRFIPEWFKLILLCHLSYLALLLLRKSRQWDSPSSSYRRFSSNLAAMLLSQHLASSSRNSDQCYSLAHDVMGIPESNGMRFDLMLHIHKLM